MVWYSHLFKNFPQFVVIHIVRGHALDSSESNSVGLGWNPPICIFNKFLDAAAPTTRAATLDK